MKKRMLSAILTICMLVSPQQLASFAYMVNTENVSASNTHFKLGGNIDLGGAAVGQRSKTISQTRYRAAQSSRARCSPLK